MTRKMDGQRRLDAARKYYEITFPMDMDDKSIHAFIRSIGKNLKGGHSKRDRMLSGVPTIVFEVWASPQGITHRLRVPEEASVYLIGQLQNSLPGIDVSEVVFVGDSHDLGPFNDSGTHSDSSLSGIDGNEIVLDNRDSGDQPTDDPLSGGFQFGATLHLRNSSEELPIINAIDYSRRVLASMQDASKEHDAICISWVIAHSDNQKQPPSDRPVQTERTSLLRTLLIGDPRAGRDEVKTRRNKQADQNYIAVGRIGSRAGTVQRAEQLVRQVVRAFTSEGGTAHFYAKGSSPQRISEEIRLGHTPLTMTAQLNVSELAAVIGWPQDNSYIPGLKRGTTRHLPAPETVPRNGRVLGMSTMPGLDRQIAMSYEASASHLYVAGQTGTGKSTLLTNLIRQDMETGAGIILIEREGSLFKQALDQVPPHRRNDVICVDLNSNQPLGLNLLRLNKPEIVAGNLVTLLDALYPDNKSIYSTQLVQHGVPVLASLNRSTLSDLLTLVHPRTPVDKMWAKSAVESVGDKRLQDFWTDWYKDEKQMAQNSQPLKNRLWELLASDAVRYLLNQETSSFEPYDVIMGNKILLVNLAGVSEQAASLIGSMIVTALWSAAVRANPTKPTFLYMDEFQQFIHLNDEFLTMLATARRQNLGLVIATQYLERLPKSMQDAVMANTRTKVIFQSSAKSATTHAEDFASQHVKKEAFMNLKAYQALVRVNTEVGVSPPITLQTFPAAPGYGLGAQILRESAQTYGRDLAAIKRADETRRIVKSNAPTKVQKEIGRSSY